MAHEFSITVRSWDNPDKWVLIRREDEDAYNSGLASSLDGKEYDTIAEASVAAKKRSKTFDEYDVESFDDPFVGEFLPGASPADKEFFDPEGSDYDYKTAMGHGLNPGPEGNWPSRVPSTGRLLKGRGHETWHMTVKGELDRGNEISRDPETGLYFSQPTEFSGVGIDSPQLKSFDEGGKVGVKSLADRLEERVRKNDPELVDMMFDLGIDFPGHVSTGEGFRADTVKKMFGLGDDVVLKGLVRRSQRRGLGGIPTTKSFSYGPEFEFKDMPKSLMDLEVPTENKLTNALRRDIIHRLGRHKLELENPSYGKVKPGDESILEMKRAHKSLLFNADGGYVHPRGGIAGLGYAEGGGVSTHTVKSGDVVSRIARDRGTTVQAIQEANKNLDVDNIRVGQKIIIPVPDRIMSRARHLGRGTSSEPIYLGDPHFSGGTMGEYLEKNIIARESFDPNRVTFPKILDKAQYPDVELQGASGSPSAFKKGSGLYPEIIRDVSKHRADLLDKDWFAVASTIPGKDSRTREEIISNIHETPSSSSYDIWRGLQGVGSKLEDIRKTNVRNLKSIDTIGHEFAHKTLTDNEGIRYYVENIIGSDRELMRGGMTSRSAEELVVRALGMKYGGISLDESADGNWTVPTSKIKDIIKKIIKKHIGPLERILRGEEDPIPQGYARGGIALLSHGGRVKKSKSRLDSLREDIRVRWDENDKPYANPELSSTTRTLVQRKIWAAQGGAPGLTGALTKVALEAAMRFKRPMQTYRAVRDLVRTKGFGRLIGEIGEYVSSGGLQPAGAGAGFASPPVGIGALTPIQMSMSGDVPPSSGEGGKIIKFRPKPESTGKPRDPDQPKGELVEFKPDPGDPSRPSLYPKIPDEVLSKADLKRYVQSEWIPPIDRQLKKLGIKANLGSLTHRKDLSYLGRLMDTAEERIKLAKGFNVVSGNFPRWKEKLPHGFSFEEARDNILDDVQKILKGQFGVSSVRITKKDYARGGLVTDMMENDILLGALR